MMEKPETPTYSEEGFHGVAFLDPGLVLWVGRQFLQTCDGKAGFVHCRESHDVPRIHRDDRNG